MNKTNEKRFCSKCGAEMQAGEKFCAKCGNQNEAFTEVKSKSKKKGKKKFVVIGIAVIIVIMLISGIGGNEGYDVEVREGEKLISNQSEYDNMQTGEKVVMVVNQLAHTTEGGCDWISCFANSENGKMTGELVAFAFADKAVDLSTNEVLIISGIFKEIQIIDDNTKVAVLDVYDYRLPGDSVSNVTENEKTAIGEEKDFYANNEVIDLYQYRMATEEVITSNLKFSVNEAGMYPSMENLMIMCMDGSVYSITLTEDDKGKYSFLGISVGDDIDTAKEKLSKFYTFVETYATDGNMLQDIYSDNEFGSLALNYDMSTYEIKDISYVAENVESSGENITSQGIIQSKSFVWWDDMREIEIVVDFISDVEGLITFNFTDSASGEKESYQHNFMVSNEGVWFEIYDTEGSYLQAAFEIDMNGECETLRLYDTESGTVDEFMEKEYAYNNVG